MIGVIAEDMTDCDTIATLIRRVATAAGATHLPRVKKRAKKGCARVRRKAKSALMELATSGCVSVVIVHDLDRNPNNGNRNDEKALNAALSAIPVPSGISRLVCIPIEELEAWFWCDEKVVKLVGRGKGKVCVNPHQIKQPKERLIRLSIAANGKPRYSTLDNPHLAEKLDLDNCARRCRAFQQLSDFVHAHLETAPAVSRAKRRRC